MALRAFTGFVFLPPDVERLLTELTHLAAALPRPAKEGEPSAAFSAARRSRRELYRALANPQWPHLVELLQAVDECVGAGFRQPTLLQTRARKAFVPALGEIRAAEHFLRRGYAIGGFDTTKGSESVPDLLVEAEGTRVAVEVYCPRAWEGLDDYVDELKDVLNQLDLPFDYEYELRVDQLEQFEPGPTVLHLHPGELADALADPAYRAELAAPLLEQVTAAIAVGEDVSASVETSDLNVRTSITVENVVRAAAELPVRAGVISGPPISGYRPEGMFGRLLRRARSKAARRQAASAGGDQTLLVVDLTSAELTSELEHELYRGMFAQEIAERWGTAPLGYDAIALCEGRGWRDEYTTHFLRFDDAADEPLLLKLIGAR